MTILMDYIQAFIVGGLICALSQIILDKTKITPARLLVSYVVLGVILGAVGIYKYVVEFGGAGATVPIIGFGFALANGVKEAVDKDGIIGIFTGGIIKTAAGVTASVFFGYVIALIFKPRSKI